MARCCSRSEVVSKTAEEASQGESFGESSCRRPRLPAITGLTFENGYRNTKKSLAKVAATIV